MVDEGYAGVGSDSRCPAAQDLDKDWFGEKSRDCGENDRLYEGLGSNIKANVHFDAFEEHVFEEATSRIIFEDARRDRRDLDVPADFPL